MKRDFVTAKSAFEKAKSHANHNDQREALKAMAEGLSKLTTAVEQRLNHLSAEIEALQDGPNHR